MGAPMVVNTNEKDRHASLAMTRRSLELIWQELSLSGRCLPVALGELAFNQFVRMPDCGVGIGEVLGLDLAVGADPPEADGDGVAAGRDLPKLGRTSFDELEISFHGELWCVNGLYELVAFCRRFEQLRER